ncbi:hypothetical protein [Neorhizobium petrolearium]|uniref:Uncharacterized protein n=1 Tax=Neorhizobium petrolearium TaxID=515361 RepID=A0ABY8MCR3_9HYPH|nr:hypothetical protein [Neorhizobium petrolearium]MCC2614551.1 hypothetical protein [Neorhizobium petrolearium]WGI72310.1 hypothetical protein QEO92_32760 [Neorhizobium petrolearium]
MYLTNRNGQIEHGGSRMAYKSAKVDLRKRFEARQRQRAAEAAGRRERQSIEGRQMTLPWKRKSDPFMLRRYVEAGALIGQILLSWLVVAIFWGAFPASWPTIGLAIAVAIFTLQLTFFLGQVLLINGLEDCHLETADRLIAMFRRNRR